MSKNGEEEISRMRSAEKAYLSENMPFGSLHIDVPLTFEKESSLLKEAGFQRVELGKEWTNTKLYRCKK